MNEFFSLISNEKRSLARGFLAIFALALPFALLYFLLRHGFSLYSFGRYLPQSALLAGFVALFLLGLLLIKNYQKLVQKRTLLKLPAFEQLQFKEATEGIDALVKEISPYLIGKVGDYFFRISLLLTSGKTVGVELSPLLYIGQNETLLHQIMRDLRLEERLYLSRVLWLTKEQLQVPGLLMVELEGLAKALRERSVAPLQNHAL